MIRSTARWVGRYPVTTLLMVATVTLLVSAVIPSWSGLVLALVSAILAIGAGMVLFWSERR